MIFPEFSLMALASAIEPLRAANRLADRQLYTWHLLSPEQGGVSSSSGFELQTTSIDDAPPIDRLFIVASLRIEKLHDARVNRFLQRLAATGTTLGALSTGTFVLARAGLLSGHQCTLHWESLRQFAEEFPTIQVCRELYVRDRTRWTCAGGTAAIDLMLDQISSDYGGQLAADVAEQFLHSRIRGPHEHQRMAIQWRYGVNDSRITAAIACMEENLEHLVAIEDIAKRCNLSLRQLERLWHHHFGMTPQRFYLAVRLNEARRLLKESTESISSIALRCGFVSASHLGSAYRNAHGHTPGDERRKSDNR
nr:MULTISPECIES: GlxA family transcriptional regulator [Bordetella]